jgi:hypothetical protein
MRSVLDAFDVILSPVSLPLENSVSSLLLRTRLCQQQTHCNMETVDMKDCNMQTVAMKDCNMETVDMKDCNMETVTV